MPLNSPVADRDQFNFSTELRVRLPETDAFGTVFHASFKNASGKRDPQKRIKAGAVCPRRP